MEKNKLFPIPPPRSSRNFPDAKTRDKEKSMLDFLDIIQIKNKHFKRKKNPSAREMGLSPMPHFFVQVPQRNGK